MPRSRKMAYLALLLAGALILYIVEGWLPPLFLATPGVKLGLSNMVGLFVLMRYGAPEALGLTALKCVIGGLLGGNPIGILYSGAASCRAIDGRLVVDRAMGCFSLSACHDRAGGTYGLVCRTMRSANAALYPTIAHTHTDQGV